MPKKLNFFKYDYLGDEAYINLDKITGIRIGKLGIVELTDQGYLVKIKLSADALIRFKRTLEGL